MRYEIPLAILGFAVLTSANFATPQPTSSGGPAVSNGGERLKSSPADTTFRSSEAKRGNVNHGLPFNYQLSPDSGVREDRGPLARNTYFRARRSPGISGKSQPSPELQTLISGNWHGMDPESLFRLVTNLASKEKESPYEDEGFYNDDDDELYSPIIDLSYSGSGRKPYPLVSGTTGLESEVSRQNKPVAFPTKAISLMTSSVEKTHGFGNEDEDDDDPITLHVHRLQKKALYPLLYPDKRSHVRKVWPLERTLELYFPRTFQKNMKDFTMLPNGEIALTNHGLLALRHHPSPLLLDDGIPIIRRPIL